MGFSDASADGPPPPPSVGPRSRIRRRSGTVALVSGFLAATMLGGYLVAGTDQEAAAADRQRSIRNGPVSTESVRPLAASDCDVLAQEAGTAVGTLARGADVTLNVVIDDPAEMSKNYKTMIEQIRAALSSRRVTHTHPDRPSTSATVDVTATGGAPFIFIDVHQAQDLGVAANPFVRLVMRRSDAYIVGWYVGQFSINGVILQRFFPIEPNLVGPIDPGSIPAVHTYEGLLQYTHLEQVGGSRTEIRVGAAELDGAVRAMRAADPSARGPQPSVAKAIMQMAMAIAEGTRFRNQAVETCRAMARGVGMAITASHIDHHTNWAKLSRVVLTGTLVGGAIIVGGVTLTTTFAVAALLMLALASAAKE